MSDPRRILDGPSTTPFERDLLESWASEQPSPAARARALAIAGAAAGTLAAATAATAVAASTGAAAGTAAPGAAGAGAGAGIAMIAKWGILSALVVGSAVGGVLVLRSASSADAPPAVAPTSSVAMPAMTTMTAPSATIAPAPSPAPPQAPSDEPKAVSPADLPAAAPLALPASPASAAATSGTTTTASFAEEIASFDRARTALDAGDSDRAIALVDIYERRFPAGTFLQEAEVLRVQALTRKGDSASARRVGQRFLAAHPTSPHAARIRAILDASAR